MLEVQEHLDRCTSCSEEYLVIRQVKSMLRAMPMRDAGPALERSVRDRISDEQTMPFPVLAFAGNHAPSSLTGFATPQRGRRLAFALALSCLGILSVAAQLGSAENTPRRFAGAGAAGLFSMTSDALFAQSVAIDKPMASIPVVACGNLASPAATFVSTPRAVEQQRSSDLWSRMRPAATGFSASYAVINQDADAGGSGLQSPTVTIASFSH